MIKVDTIRVKFETEKTAVRVKLFGHKGVSAHFPENTLAAFRAAVDLDCVDGIELDIHCSADGVPVALHDESLERTTNGSGLVLDRTVTELAKIDAGIGEYVPAFDKVVRLVDGKLDIDLEIKSKH
jgi:glycerophosphoryl diester phosphodiesterase